MSYGMNGSKAPSGYETGKLSNYTPQQTKLSNQLYGDVGQNSYLRRLAGGDQGMFDEIEKPAWQDFQAAQGQLASRFSGGGVGHRQGSGFANAANQQSSDFATQLQSQRMGLQRQAQQDLFSMSQQLLGNQPYQNYLVPKEEKKGFDWGGLAGAATGAVAGFFDPTSPGISGSFKGAASGYNAFGR